MAENVSKLPVRQEKTQPSTGLGMWQPFEGLRREIERVFDDFGMGSWRPLPMRWSRWAEPLLRRETTWAAIPAVDVIEGDKAYKVTAELPGMDEKSIEVKVTDGNLTIKGEKKEEKEEKEKDYYLRERHFGSFERSFNVPESVDLSKIEASFKKGVLTVMLPKKAEAQKPEKKIEVKAA